MQIEIPQDTSRKVERASKELGIAKKQLVERAILLYLDNLSKYISLKKEMREWDFLSDEALSKFEKSL